VTNKAKEDITTWVDNSISKLHQEYVKIKGDATKTMTGAATTVKKEVGHGLDQYNAKAQEMVDQVPGGFSAKVAKYPWVTFSLALAFGFLVGVILKPTRRPIEQF